MGMIGFNYLISEGWSSPTFTMLLDVTNPKTQGLTVNVYFLFCMTAAMIGNTLIDHLNQIFMATTDPAYYGYILGTFMMVSYIGSGICFLIAGCYYKRFVENLKH